MFRYVYGFILVALLTIGEVLSIREAESTADIVAGLIGFVAYVPFFMWLILN